MYKRPTTDPKESNNRTTSSCCIVLEPVVDPVQRFVTYQAVGY